MDINLELLDFDSIQLVGHAPEKSGLVLLSEEAWKGFLEDRGIYSGLYGLYEPANLLAYACFDDAEVCQSVVHEYYGHGNFCEHTSKGRDIVELDRRIREHENRIFGRLLRADEVVELVICNSTRGEYVRLRQLKEKLQPVYEDYAEKIEKMFLQLWRMRGMGLSTTNFSKV